MIVNEIINKFGVPYRNNTHQTHFEDLVLEGKEGLDELDDKVTALLKGLEGGDSGLNLTTKIDGAPALAIGRGIEGYPEHFIGIKSVLNGPQNAYSSEEEIDAHWPGEDRASFKEMLKYGLELAAIMPEGEVWQGDCLFVQSTLDHENIDGVDCVTFQPNKILYAAEEDSKTGQAIENAKFGIAFHTKYIREGDGWRQSFTMYDAADKLRAAGAGDDFFFMGVQLSAVEGSKPDEDAKNNAIMLADQLEREEDKLRSNDVYDAMCKNDDFMKVAFRTFENASTSDKQSVTIDEDDLISNISKYLKGKMKTAYDKKFASLKTDKGRAKATANYDQSLLDLDDYLNNHSDVIAQIVKTLNIAAKLKMVLWNVFKNFKNGDAKTYLRSRTKGIIPTGMEGVAVSDDDGNIVKIVDKTSFSNANRDPDYMSGFEHNQAKKVGESIKANLQRLAEWIRIQEAFGAYLPNEEPAAKAFKAAVKKVLLNGGLIQTEKKSESYVLNKKYIFQTDQTDNHNREILRFRPSTVDPTSFDTDVFISTVEDIVSEAQIEDPNIKNVSFGAMNKYGENEGTSSTYLSLEITYTYNDNPQKYKMYACFNSGAKKMFTPNALLEKSLLGTNIDIDHIVNVVNYKDDPSISGFFKTILEATKDVEFDEALLPFVKYRKIVDNGESPADTLRKLAPGDFYLKVPLAKVHASQFERSVSDIPTISKNVSSIFNDFGEVIAGAAIANALKKNGYSNDLFIKYPAESNYPLADFFILRQEGDEQKISISAKNEKGGKATVTSPFADVRKLMRSKISTLDAENKELLNFIEIISNDSKLSVNQQFIELGKKCVDIAFSDTGFQLLNSAIDSLNIRQDIIDIDELDPNNVNSNSYEEAKAFLDKAMKTANRTTAAFAAKHEKMEILKANYTSIEVPNTAISYLEAYKTRCLVKILISLFNISKLKPLFNTWLDAVLGTFVQDYVNPTGFVIDSWDKFVNAEYITILCKPKSYDGKSLSNLHDYKLYMDCSIEKLGKKDPNSDYGFVQKALAMVME